MRWHFFLDSTHHCQQNKVESKRIGQFKATNKSTVFKATASPARDALCKMQESCPSGHGPRSAHNVGEGDQRFLQYEPQPVHAAAKAAAGRGQELQSVRTHKIFTLQKKENNWSNETCLVHEFLHWYHHDYLRRLNKADKKQTKKHKCAS